MLRVERLFPLAGWLLWGGAVCAGWLGSEKRPPVIDGNPEGIGKFVEGGDGNGGQPATFEAGDGALRDADLRREIDLSQVTIDAKPLNFLAKREHRNIIVKNIANAIDNRIGVSNTNTVLNARRIASLTQVQPERF